MDIELEEASPNSPDGMVSDTVQQVSSWEDSLRSFFYGDRDSVCVSPLFAFYLVIQVSI
jgi:hypothetical protein